MRDVTGEQALHLFAESNATSLGADHAILDAAMLQTAADAGTPLVPWTVNHPAALDRLMRAPGVLTDMPRPALETRRRLRPDRRGSDDQARTDSEAGMTPRSPAL